MDGPHLRISKTLRRHMQYAKAAAPGLRMLVLESRYWLDEACARAAQRLGWTVRRAPVVAAGHLPRDQVATLLQDLIELRPDFILTINHSGMDCAGLFCNLFADLGIPLVTWFVDDPRTILMDRAVHGAPTTIAATWERGYMDYLRALGFGHVYHLPLAADTTVFHGAPSAAPDLAGAFVGNSMISFANRVWQEVAQYPVLAEAVTAAFAAGTVDRARFVAGLDHLLEPALVAGFDQEARRHAEMYFFIEGTRRLRRRVAQALAPEGMGIRGDEDWNEEFPQAGPPVPYEEELPDFYRRCAVNVNTTSIQMATAVNQRVFDCPAAGGFVLTDAQEDLGALFDSGAETAVYHSLEEGVEKYRYYRDRPAQRLPLIHAAQKRILAHHTYTHRLQTVAGWVREHFGD
jgi:spore maturation protein CgeB